MVRLDRPYRRFCIQSGGGRYAGQLNFDPFVRTVVRCCRGRGRADVAEALKQTGKEEGEQACPFLFALSGRKFFGRLAAWFG